MTNGCECGSGHLAVYGGVCRSCFILNKVDYVNALGEERLECGCVRRGRIVTHAEHESPFVMLHMCKTHMKEAHARTARIKERRRAAIAAGAAIAECRRALYAAL